MRRHAASAIAGALLALCAVRLLSFWAHQPMWAYGNNYDQVRYTACAHVFPHRPGVDPGLYSPEGPLVAFSRQPQVRGPCIWTTEHLFVSAFARVLAAEEARGADGIASVRVAGLARALVFLAVLGAFVVLLARRGRPAAAIGVAAAAALVGCDPAMLLWLNTFYAEFTASVALLACFAVLVLAWDEPPAARRRAGLAFAMALAAVALAMGKVQFGALPLALALGAAIAAAGAEPSMRRSRMRRLAPFAAAAVAGLALQLAAISRTDDPALPLWHKVGTFNFAFNGVLGSSADPARTARRIGLPESCAALAGRTIFDFRRREQWEAACPEVFALRRASVLARLAAAEPGTLVRLGVRAATGLHPWVQRELGHVAGVRYGDVTRERWSAGPWLERHPAIALAFVLAPLAWVSLALPLRRLRRGRLELAWLGAWLANAVIWQQLVLTAIGDGVHDLSRQAFLVFAAALGWSVAVAGAAVAAALARAGGVMWPRLAEKAQTPL